MRLRHEFEVDRSVDEVWGRLWDVELVAGCIRGCTDVRTVEPFRSYAATISQSLGPFRVAFPLAIEVRDMQPPRSLSVAGTGRDARIASRVQGTLDACLSEADGGGTRVVVDVDLALQGRIATLGHGIVERKGRDELAHFAEALRETLSRSADAPGTEPVARDA
ncbi:MAG: SRPBCC domain-containing protein [Chloroflexi bacterium]|nr:SRPBCC domain-containing protein [Chloroflexota bacterium]